VTVVILLADGLRPDTLRSAMDAGNVPALAQLRDEGSLQTITTCFPSVTGPAYTPFLMGRFPGPVGLPGIRWFDRERVACSFPDYTRSYVGHQVNRINTDLDSSAPTIFELCERSLGSLTPVTRGLRKGNRIGRLKFRTAWRVARTHFGGNVAGWLDIDAEAADLVVDHIRTNQPDFTFAALVGIDKTSHATGQPSPLVDDALRIVDRTAARIRADAERDGRWPSMHLWVTSDHGHSRVTAHEDLAGRVAGWGFRTIAHPLIYTMRPEIAVMVSGNAMAHLYVDVGARQRTLWPDMSERHRSLVDRLLELASVDLVILPDVSGATIRTRSSGDAYVAEQNGRFSYRRSTGDPLGIGRDVERATANENYELTVGTGYPDSIVQIARLAQARRSGEIILSAAHDWDFRSRHEPITHVSCHGALYREHMIVPLLSNRRYAAAARRTTDLMPSALAALGRAVPSGLDGESFI
jgi:hypothetical protein